jgi:hypothetical protein
MPAQKVRKTPAKKSLRRRSKKFLRPKSTPSCRGHFTDTPILWLTEGNRHGAQFGLERFGWSRVTAGHRMK